jgi:hypothetical protein
MKGRKLGEMSNIVKLQHLIGENTMNMQLKQVSVEENVEQQQSGKFLGFIYPAPKGHSQLSNDWFDEIISQIDNVAELKVVLYVFRHTCGFQKPTTPVQLTNDEFMNGRTRYLDGTRMDRGTGMSEMSIRNGLKKAEKHGYIISTSDTSNKGNIRKSYVLHFLEGVQILDLTTSESPEGVQDLDPQVQTLDRGGTQFREKHLKFVPQACSKTGGKERERQLNTDRNTGEDSSINKKKKRGSTDQEPMSKATEKEFRVRAKDWEYTRGDEVERGLDIYQRANLGDNLFYEQIVNASVGVHTMDEFFNRLWELFGLEPIAVMEG